MEGASVGGEDFEGVVGVEAVFPAVEVEDVVVPAAEERLSHESRLSRPRFAFERTMAFFREHLEPGRHAN